MSWKWVCRLAAAVFPWAPRAERRAQVAAARQRAEAAQRKVEDSAALRRDLDRIRKENHIAQAIMDGIVQSHRRQGGGLR